MLLSLSNYIKATLLLKQMQVFSLYFHFSFWIILVYLHLFFVCALLSSFLLFKWTFTYNCYPGLSISLNFTSLLLEFSINFFRLFLPNFIKFSSTISPQLHLTLLRTSLIYLSLFISSLLRYSVLVYNYLFVMCFYH